MRKVTPDELLPLGAYEQVRDRFRQRLIAHKRPRRIFLGPEMSLLFEDHDTVLLQVQEMLRAERISSPRGVRDELDVYNGLVPPDGALLATLMIELEDPALRERRRREYVGLDAHVHFALGVHVAHAEMDPEGRFDDRISAVRYVTFRMPEGARAMLLDGSVPARIYADHPRYQAEVVLTEATRAALAEDLANENAENARG